MAKKPIETAVDLVVRLIKAGCLKSDDVGGFVVIVVDPGGDVGYAGSPLMGYEDIARACRVAGVGAQEKAGIKLADGLDESPAGTVH